jgi:hypothetical protein
MGRVLRRKAADRTAHIVIMYVQGTTEDPHCGAHGTFLDSIEDAAAEIQNFDHEVPAAEICAYLGAVA